MNSSILQPSTATSGLCTRRGDLWYWQFFRRGVCDGNVLSPPLPVCPKEVGSKAPSNLLHHLHSNTNHNKHMFGRPKLRRSSRLSDLLQGTIQQCCLLFTALLAGSCQSSVPACVLSAQKHCAFKCDTLRPATDAVKCIFILKYLQLTTSILGRY